MSGPLVQQQVTHCLSSDVTVSVSPSLSVTAESLQVTTGESDNWNLIL